VTYLRVEDVAALLGVSVRTVHERTRLREIPCRRLPGTRRILFLEAELEAWIESGGAIPLEVVEGERGGVVVRPVEAAR
jgi:excisionase family DNA binding protein